MKNGAELLDRLIKDIVSESSATYISILRSPRGIASDRDSSKGSIDSSSSDLATAFSLAKFVPLLQERIHVINPFTRTFLVSWVTLLDTIPDLELVSYLPAFLGGLFKFLSDPNRDVHVATQGALERFLNEIKKIARIKRGVAESHKGPGDGRIKPSASCDTASIHTDHSTLNEKPDVAEAETGMPDGSQAGQTEEDWVPGQDVQVDHSKILEILVAFLDSSSGLKYASLQLNMILISEQKKKYSSLLFVGLIAFSKSVLRISLLLFRGFCPRSFQPWLVVLILYDKLRIVSITL